VWRYPQTWTETLMPALRIGRPQVVVTTTPRPIPLLRELVERDDGSVVVTRGATFDNEANCHRRRSLNFAAAMRAPGSAARSSRAS
jgi:phage terminase large subunit-like protein